ncbi:MAG: sialidase family protein [Chloroflexota bacterium]
MHHSRLRRSWAAPAVLSLTLLVAAGGTAQALTYGPPVSVVSGPDIAFGSTELAAGGGVAHAEYETVDADMALTGTFYKRSTDGGASWTDQTELVDAAHAQNTDTWGLAASGQLVVAAFTGHEPGNVQRLFLRRSTDAGAHWSGALTVTSVTSASHVLGFVAVAVSGQLVVVAWDDLRTHTVRLRRSVDGGTSFKPAVKIGAYQGEYASPHVAVSGARVYVTWLAQNPAGEAQIWSGLKLRRSADSGATFKAAQTLFAGRLGDSETPLAASGKRFVALIQMHNTGSFKVLRSANGGATVSATTIVPPDPNPGGRSPGGIAIDGLQVRAAWDEHVRSFTRSSADGGATWADADEPFSSESFAGYVRIALLGAATIVIAQTSNDTTDIVKSRAT